MQLRKPERSKFDLSHEKKLTTRMGKLVPVFISETLPNDTFRVNTEVMLRFAPLLAPIYHRVNVFIHFFYVPIRILYKDWEALITNGRLGTETPPVSPYFTIGDLLSSNENFLDVGSLWDYFGGVPIPDTEVGYNSSDYPLSALPWAAYYKCWYDYYRDRNYVEDNDILPLPSGALTNTYEPICFIKNRAWMHDYFTSALPFTQRGDEVLMPIEFSVDEVYQVVGGATNTQAGPVTADNAGALIVSAGGVPEIGLRGDNSSASINDLRQAIRLQEWLERNAVAGSRYNESIMAHFARRTSDGRLQRAEYLGGGRVPVQISEVMTTAWSQDGGANDVPPANPSGRGATYSNKNSFVYNCEEHGFVIGIMSVMPISGYMQGIPRMFTNRQTFLDYPWPSFAHLGEQEVGKSELYATPATVPSIANPDGVVFGYQSRYADWKYISNTAHGEFRSSLDYWIIDRKFSTTPALGEEFVTFEDALQDRIFAVAESDTIWCYVHNEVSAVRSLPYFGTPRL